MDQALGMTGKAWLVMTGKPWLGTTGKAWLRITIAQNKNTPQVNLRRWICYYLTAHCDWAQYLLTLQSVLHVGRARLLPFPVGATCRFRKAPRLAVLNSIG